MNVCIFRPVELYNSGAVLGVVPEVEGVTALGYVDDVLAMEGVVGDHTVDGLLYPQALGVVHKAGGGAALAHLLQLTVVLPGVGPGAVGERIANGVVGDRRAIVLGQLVFPVAVPVRIGDRLKDRAHCARGVRIPLLAQNIAATVVIIDPGGAHRAAGGVVLVVDLNQLAQIVVSVIDRWTINSLTVSFHSASYF